MQENGMRTRSFRNEDYHNRRVFLRSYPLDWGESDEESRDESKTERFPKVTGETERIIKDKDKGKGKGKGKVMSKTQQRTTKESDAKMAVSKKVVAALKWGGGKIVMLRRFRHRIVVYVVTCLPIRFKAPTALISA